MTDNNQTVLSDLSNTPPSVISTETAIQYILSKYTIVSEKRVQALAFASELEWHTKHTNDPDTLPLTNASFVRTHRGVFSQDVQDTIESIDDVYTRTLFPSPRKPCRYGTKHVSKPDTTDFETAQQTAFDVIDAVYENASDFTTEEVMDGLLEYIPPGEIDTETEIDIQEFAPK